MHLRGACRIGLGLGLGFVDAGMFCMRRAWDMLMVIYLDTLFVFVRTPPLHSRILVHFPF